MVIFVYHLKTTIMKTSMNIVNRLELVAGFINRNPKLSTRTMRWIDEYNALKKASPSFWKRYCEKNGLDLTHDGYDCLAD